MSNGDQEINGKKTFENLAISNQSITAFEKAYQLPKEGDELVGCKSEQTLANKSFDGLKNEYGFPIVFKTPVKNYSVIAKPITQERTYSLYDANTDADIAIKFGVPSKGGIAYGDGHLIRFTAQGSKGLPLISGGREEPNFDILTEDGGGTGQKDYKPGDILVAGADGKLTKLPLGEPGQVLSVNKERTGIIWK